MFRALQPQTSTRSTEKLALRKTADRSVKSHHGRNATRRRLNRLRPSSFLVCPVSSFECSKLLDCVALMRKAVPVPRLSRLFKSRSACTLVAIQFPCKSVAVEHGDSVSSRRVFSSSTTSSSVSSQEVSKFSGMDEIWWDPRKNPLVSMNPIRVQYILDTFRRFESVESKNKNPPLHEIEALDVGCGGGLLSESLARLGASVTAIDPSGPLVERAQQHALKDVWTESIDYRAGVAIEDLTNERHFDVICILEVIEHATDVDGMLQAASTLLKPDGILFVSTISKTWKSYAMCIVGAEYVMGYLPIGTHDWNQFQSPQQVEERMERANFKAFDVSGMIMTAPRVDGTWGWRLDPNDTDVNWIGAYRHAT